jgi:hypothetical protein
MDDSPLRDAERHVERWRDKLELRLDNRQVFFLFFGSAVVACMLFVLGVMVGKRIESRGRRHHPSCRIRWRRWTACRGPRRARRRPRRPSSRFPIS